MKKIGILGGISAVSTAQYYNKLLTLYYEMKQDYYYPEITIESLNFQHFTDLENCQDLSNYKKYILKGIHNLEMAGSEVIIMAANSPHSVFSTISASTDIPVLSIVESVKNYALKTGMKNLLLTGISHTMRNTFYHDELKKNGINVISPSASDQNVINNIIFNELSLNKILPYSQSKFLSIIETYKNDFHIDGVILGCTELPAFCAKIKSSIPFIDSLELHCKDTLLYALNS